MGFLNVVILPFNVTNETLYVITVFTISSSELAAYTLYIHTLVYLPSDGQTFINKNVHFKHLFSILNTKKLTW